MKRDNVVRRINGSVFHEDNSVLAFATAGETIQFFGAVRAIVSFSCSVVSCSNTTVVPKVESVSSVRIARAYCAAPNAPCNCKTGCVPCPNSGSGNCGCSGVLDLFSNNDCGFGYFTEALAFVSDSELRVETAPRDIHVLPREEFSQWWNGGSTSLDCSQTPLIRPTDLVCPALISSSCSSCNSAKTSDVIEGAFAVVGGLFMIIGTLGSLIYEIWRVHDSSGAAIPLNPYFQK